MTRCIARLVVMAIAMMVPLGACGGGSDETAEPAGVDAADDSAASEAAPDGGDGTANYASVTVGDSTFEIPADPVNGCNSLDDLIFGSFAVNAAGTPTQAGSPEASIQVNFGIPVTDWQDRGLQAPLVNVDLLDEGVRWMASIERGLGSVDSWQLADGVASGEASFVGQTVGSGEQVGVTTGTFEVRCR